MSGTARTGIQYVLDAIAAEKSEALDGRSGNASYRITDGVRQLSVKIHSAGRSSDLEFQRILRVDTALRELAWYPPLLDLGFHTERHRHLVAVRPYVPGVPSNDARRHISTLLRVLADLAERGGVDVATGLVGDYASPWLSDGEREQRLTRRLLTGQWPSLSRTLDGRLGALRDSALRLTRTEGLAVYHGDLHGRNLILHPSRPLTVIDWDEAGFSLRPADAGKSLWLSCRRGRGDFLLDPAAAFRFLAQLHTRLRVPYADTPDLARLGAMWFLPRHSHVTLLRERDEGLVTWYLGWVSRFWARFQSNMDLLIKAAEVLEREADPG